MSQFLIIGEFFQNSTSSVCWCTRIFTEIWKFKSNFWKFFSSNFVFPKNLRERNFEEGIFDNWSEIFDQWNGWDAISSQWNTFYLGLWDKLDDRVFAKDWEFFRFLDSFSVCNELIIGPKILVIFLKKVGWKSVGWSNPADTNQLRFEQSTAFAFVTQTQATTTGSFSISVSSSDFGFAHFERSTWGKSLHLK